MSQTIQPIINPTYPDLLNVVLLNGNTNLVIIKENSLMDGHFENEMALAVQDSLNDNSNDAVISVREVYTKNSNGEKVFVSSSVKLGSTTHGYGAEVFSDGRVFVKTKQYTTTELAQDDTSLQVGESYMCNGFHMYKQ